MRGVSDAGLAAGRHARLLCRNRMRCVSLHRFILCEIANNDDNDNCILIIIVVFNPSAVPDSTRAHASNDKAPKTAADDLHQMSE